MKYHLADFVGNPRLVDSCDDEILIGSRAVLASEEYFGQPQPDDCIYVQHILLKGDFSEGGPWDFSNAVYEATSAQQVRHLLRFLVMNKLGGHNWFWEMWGGQDLEWQKFLQRHPVTEQKVL